MIQRNEISDWQVQGKLIGLGKATIIQSKAHNNHIQCPIGVLVLRRSSFTERKKVRNMFAITYSNAPQLSCGGREECIKAGDASGAGEGRAGHCRGHM